MLKNIWKAIRRDAVLVSLLSVAFGVVLLLHPGFTMTVVCRILGSVLLIAGLTGILSYFIRGGAFKPIAGTIQCLLGIWMLVWPGAIASLLPVAFGLILVCYGGSNLHTAMLIRQYGGNRWGIDVVMALITFIFGAIVVFNPFETAELLMRFIGVGLVYNGVSNIWLLFRETRTAQRVVDRDSLGEIIDEDE